MQRMRLVVKEETQANLGLVLLLFLVVALLASLRFNQRYEFDEQAKRIENAPMHVQVRLEQLRRQLARLDVPISVRNHVSEVLTHELLKLKEGEPCSLYTITYVHEGIKYQFSVDSSCLVQKRQQKISDKGKSAVSPLPIFLCCRL